MESLLKEEYKISETPRYASQPERKKKNYQESVPSLRKERERVQYFMHHPKSDNKGSHKKDLTIITPEIVRIEKSNRIIEILQNHVRDQTTLFEEKQKEIDSKLK